MNCQQSPSVLDKRNHPYLVLHSILWLGKRAKWKLTLQVITTTGCAGLYSMEKLKLDPNQELTFPHVVALALFLISCLMMHFCYEAIIPLS